MKFRFFILLILLYINSATSIQYPHAYWDSATSSTVSWYQTERTCLYWQAEQGQPVFVNCYARYPATIIITFGHAGSLDGALRPSAHGRYVLHSATETIFSPLIGRSVYLPVMAH